MRNILIMVCLVFMAITGPTIAQNINLGLVMKSISVGFKASLKAARSDDNSEEAKQIVEKLHADTVRASEILPETVDPEDQELKARYQKIMGELTELSKSLVVAFDTNPLNQEEAMAILKQMNSLRKKGHATFR